MYSIKNLIQREPVAVAAALRVALLAGVSFGLNVSAEQVASLVIAVETILALLTRGAVSPVEQAPPVMYLPGPHLGDPDTEV